MTKIDEKYMDIKPQTNMNISEGWRVYRHARMFIKVYNTFWHTFGCDTHLFNIHLLTKLHKINRGSLSLETHSLHNLSTRQIKFRFFSMKLTI